MMKESEGDWEIFCTGGSIHSHLSLRKDDEDCSLILYLVLSAAGHGVIGGLGHIRWGITVVIIFSTSLK